MMRKKDFDALAEELAGRICETTREFFTEKGMTFDLEAYYRQASVQPQRQVVEEMIYFGADKFPVRPDTDSQ